MNNLRINLGCGNKKRIGCINIDHKNYGQKHILDKAPAIPEQLSHRSTNHGPRAQKTNRGIHRPLECLECPARARSRFAHVYATQRRQSFEQ